jgi:hypothetical protein
MDTDDRELLSASVAAAIDPAAPSSINDAALDALGWGDMLAAEPIDAVGVVFGRLGAAAATADVLDDVVGCALGADAGAALVHPAWGRASPVGRDDSGLIGVAGQRIHEADVVHVVCADGLATVPADRLVADPPTGDTRWSPVRVDGDLTAADLTPVDGDVLSAAVTAARHALAHQLHGLAAGMLGLARQHAVDRVQFGRPIGSFQAVRHKLAETHVAIEGAAAALGAADDDPTPLTVDLARVVAGRAAADAGRHCQQVLAGIGFTRDHDFHRYLFAVIELDGLYGTTGLITQDLGRQLIAAGVVPRAVDL